MKPFDEATAGRSFKYEIGKRRLDGKHCVWTLVELLPQQWTWAIAFVAPSWRAAKKWIDDQEAREAQEARAA